MKKRVMTLVLVVVLVCTLMPVAAFAEGGSGRLRSYGAQVYTGCA